MTDVSCGLVLAAVMAASLTAGPNGETGGLFGMITSAFEDLDDEQ